MHRHVKHVHHFFIPHRGNDYHPHFLHTKRAVFYSGFFVLMKAIVFGLAVLLPLPAFVMPDVLQAQQKKLFELTNEVRAKNDRPPLTVLNKLNNSAAAKTEEMAQLSYFSHVSPDGHKLSYYLSNAGYNYQVAGENLAMGFSDAESIVAAWVKSPTHFSNLIDSDFTDTGVGLSAGFYDNKPTTYVAEHFGAPKIVKRLKVSPPAPSTGVKDTILGLKTENSPDVPNLPKYNRERSLVDWREVDNSIEVSPHVYINGNIKNIYVQIGDNKIFLAKATKENGYSKYTGSQILGINAHDLFKVILPPSLLIETTDGSTILETVPWQNPLVISPTPIEKYTLASNYMPAVAQVVNLTRNVYIVFGALFSMVLVMFMWAQFKRRRLHIVAQTAALICLLVIFIVY